MSATPTYVTQRLSSAASGELASLIIAAASAALLLSLTTPLISIILENQGAGADFIGISAALPAVGGLVIIPILPLLIRRLGPRALTVIALTTAGFCVLILEIVPSPTNALVRVVLGAAVSTVLTATEVGLAELSRPGNRGRIMGIYSAFFCLAWAAGPSLIAFADGMAVVIAIGITACALVSLSLGVSPFASPAILPKVKGRLTLAVVLPLATIFVFAAIEMGLSGLLPIYAGSEGYSGAMVAWPAAVFFAGGVWSPIPIGMLSDKIGRQKTLVGCLVLSTAGFFLWPHAAGTMVFLPLLLIQGGMVGAIYPLSLALLGDRVPRKDMPLANSVFVGCYQLGAMVGPAAAGGSMSVAGNSGLPGSMIMWLTILLIVVAMISVAQRRSHDNSRVVHPS